MVGGVSGIISKKLFRLSLNPPRASDLLMLWEAGSAVGLILPKKNYHTWFVWIFVLFCQLQGLLP